MQQVDPFIPIRPDKPVKPVKRQAGPAGPYGTRYLRKPDIAPAKLAPHRPPAAAMAPHKPVTPQQAAPRAIDGVVRAPQPVTHAPVVAIMPAATASRPPVPDTRLHARLQAREERPSTARKKHSVQLTQIALIVVGALALGLMIESLVFGELIIAIYAVYALVKHVSSRTTFILALIALAGIVVLLLVQGSDSGASNNFAVYTFLLLVIGTISLGLEIRHETA